MLILYQRESNFPSYLRQMVLLVDFAVKMIQIPWVFPGVLSKGLHTMVDAMCQRWLGHVMDPVFSA